MKPLNRLTYLIKGILFFLFLLVINPIVLSQESSNVSIDSIYNVNNIIAAENISSETEKLGERILQLRKTLQPSKSIKEIDSILKSVYNEVLVEKDSVLVDISETRLRNLKVKNVEWNNYKTKLSDYQEIIRSRTELISKISNDLYEEINKWEVTKQTLSENSDSKDLILGLDQSISSLKEMLGIAQERMDSVYSVQKTLVDLFFTVNEVISEIERAQLQIKKDYFEFDSKPIWVSNKVGKDSTSMSTISLSLIHI